MAQPTQRKARVVEFGANMVDRGARKQRKAVNDVNFVPMLQVDVKTGDILVDKRQEKYWTL